MTKLDLTDEQVLVLKAAWEFFVESEDHIEAMVEALELENEENNSDMAEERINELTPLIMSL